MLICPKCKQTSGNDWKQCGGSCPIGSSPYFHQPSVGAINAQIAAARVDRRGLVLWPKLMPSEQSITGAKSVNGRLFIVTEAFINYRALLPNETVSM